ncbi:nuclear transport factor 2 family protein [Allomuricauda sp. d1]|uniref:nuclear transport factor 2 family protein n=1 Tax=Allomuricauda sp. d1 TaxID=3136725 RepID=UPI0031E4039D
MKFFRNVAVCLLFILLSGCQQNQSKIQDTDQKQQELLSALDTFNKAFAESDLATLDSMVTDNYLHTNSSSKVIGKADWFNYLKKRDKNIKSGTVEVLEYQLQDTKIEHHGTTAVITGKVFVSTKDSLGVKENQYRITNLWVYNSGVWKRAGFHDGKIE